MSTTNRYEHAGRTEKIMKILPEFEAHVARALAVEKIDPFHEHAEIALLLAKAASRSLWNDLADLAGCRHPSDTTVDQIIAQLDFRAAKKDADPFAGL